MLENITPQESHRINSDLLKCLRSCCLAFEKSCVFMQYKLMVQPLSKCYKFSQEFRICFFMLFLSGFWEYSRLETEIFIFWLQFNCSVSLHCRY